MTRRWWRTLAVGASLVMMTTLPPAATTAAPGVRPADGPSVGSDVEALVAFWTPERRRAAQPRDIVVDGLGRSFLRRADGGLVPYGAGVMPTSKPPLAGKPARIVTNSRWKALDLPIAKASGRIFFEMPDSAGEWQGFVCSGSVVTDGASGASLILTAAHCVYDDVNGAFARASLFIPDQAATSGSATDLDCANDRYGCWAPTYGVVDQEWTTHEWPSNVEWDYGFYVVPTTGRHAGTTVSSESLEQVVGSLHMSMATPTLDAWTNAFGYSYAYDPELRYCAQGLGAVDEVNWWLSRCRLTGGASGGPWLQPFDQVTGSGSVVSVNSWGYVGGPGMAGPRFDGSSAACVRTEAEQVRGSVPEARGVTAAC